MKDLKATVGKKGSDVEAQLEEAGRQPRPRSHMRGSLGLEDSRNEIQPLDLEALVKHQPHSAIVQACNNALDW